MIKNIEENLKLNNIIHTSLCVNEHNSKLIINDDCFNVFKHIPDKSVDIIFADLPYGTTNAKWDSVLPLNKHVKLLNKRNKEVILYQDEYILYRLKQISDFNNIKNPYQYILEEFNELSTDGLWQHYDRIISNKGVVLLFSQTPFDKILGNSNIDNLRYEWIWEKTSATGYQNAKKMPMKAHENILVFYNKLPYYNPQKTTGHVRKVSSKHSRSLSAIRMNQKDDYIYNKDNVEKIPDYNSTERYPRSVIKFKSDKQKITLHPTQKPVELLKYMLKTYINPNNETTTILDNTAGSGSLGQATKEIYQEFNINTNTILIEIDKNQYQNCLNRSL